MVARSLSLILGVNAVALIIKQQVQRDSRAAKHSLDRYTIVVIHSFCHSFSSAPIPTSVLIQVQGALFKELRFKTLLAVSWIPDELFVNGPTLLSEDL